MQKTDLTTRAVAAFIDLLILMGLTRLPDVIGFLSASGYLLVRDGLLERQSIGKKLIGLRVISSDDPEFVITYRESIIRNVPLVIAYILFLLPYAGWILGPAVLGIECLTALGNERGMRIGDMLARTCVVPTAASAQQKTETPPHQQQGG
ncbi:MAG: hypothetical protein A2X58_11545 [Nitrospirae bacterium GWC2_56_14]|nr:MAG: hypothetical protein A2X58_11545 [Nitrospirae bacterium GWC2_56_14]